jgi:hypothetical protein
MQKTWRILAFAALGIASVGGASALFANQPHEAEAAESSSSTSVATTNAPALTPGGYAYIYMKSTASAWYSTAYTYRFKFTNATTYVWSVPGAITYSGSTTLPLFVVQTPDKDIGEATVTSWTGVQAAVFASDANPSVVDPLVYTSKMTSTTYNIFDCEATSAFSAYEDNPDDATQHAKYLAGVPLAERAWTNSTPNRPAASIFADNFLRQTTVCCASGNSQVLLDSQWASLASEYAAMNSTSQGFVKGATALTTPDITTYDNLLKSCVGRYDFIMHRYVSDTTLNDFMARGTKKANENPITIDESTSLPVIATIGILALASVGAYFFVRAKNKQAD